MTASWRSWRHVPCRAAGLRHSGYVVAHLSGDSGEQLRTSLRTADVVIVAIDSARSPGEALAVVGRIREAGESIPIIFVSDRSSAAEALAAFSAGATDYLEQTVSIQHLDAAIHLCLRKTLRRKLSDVSFQMSGSAFATRRLIGESAAMNEIRAAIDACGAVDSNILITGETGTGKELVAESIHEHSDRRRASFVRVNCAAIPDALVESELFGYERGAFTGADSQREGLMTLGRGGTILFDEIGDMSAVAQAKILRAIETKEIHRLGGKASVPVNVRMIAATNRDIERLAADGRFRHVRVGAGECSKGIAYPTLPSLRDGIGNRTRDAGRQRMPGDALRHRRPNRGGIGAKRVRIWLDANRLDARACGGSRHDRLRCAGYGAEQPRKCREDDDVREAVE